MREFVPLYAGQQYIHAGAVHVQVMYSVAMVNDSENFRPNKRKHPRRGQWHVFVPRDTMFVQMKSSDRKC